MPVLRVPVVAKIALLIVAFALTLVPVILRPVRPFVARWTLFLPHGAVGWPFGRLRAFDKWLRLIAEMSLWWIYDRRIALERRGESIRHIHVVIVAIIVGFLGFARRPDIASLLLLLRKHGGRDDAKIMLGVLQIAFGHHRVAG